MLAERGVALEVIRALAGHVDVRTTQIYVNITDQRKTDGIAALERTTRPLAAWLTVRRPLDAASLSGSGQDRRSTVRRPCVLTSGRAVACCSPRLRDPWRAPLRPKLIPGITAAATCD
jgi:hypothetical protein